MALFSGSSATCVRPTHSSLGPGYGRHMGLAQVSAHRRQMARQDIFYLASLVGTFLLFTRCGLSPSSGKQPAGLSKVLGGLGCGSHVFPLVLRASIP